MTNETIDTAALAKRVDDLEEAIRLAEVGEYLLNACLYSGGDGYTEPREMGVEWQWQQSAPDQYGQGMLLAAATKWHDEQAEDGVITEARQLRDLRDALTTLLRGVVWQPIETAPKDGTRILLASSAVSEAGKPAEWTISVGQWVPEFEIASYPDDGPLYRGAWSDFTVASWGYEEFTELSPTHWMLLPAPPLSTTKEG
ncbi:hypothetical protein Xaut_3673 [Xanthobacter versatilis]|uniref:DUF551 domain-containing protein n=1 Tax=Xanthobacter autotrophicus (strain ATCC BAA-1158 / Py2) TaxID=78245 RepID=A7ILK8_XANP2|nr:hypothetical protein Xaut_3673 [Xanthobacter autotrophicus Py2]